MIKKEDGFSLVELMITMVIFLFAVAAASQVFTGLLNQFKQQSKIAETNIEGMVGLDILRRDLQNAGFGVPWNVKRKNDGVVLPWTSVPNFSEAVSSGGSLPDPSCFNDATTLGVCTNPHGVQGPRAIIGLNNIGGAGKSEKYSAPNDIFNGSDYLVIKSASVATNSAAGKWQELFMNDAGGNVVKSWPQPISEQICMNQGDLTKHYPNSRAIVISPGTDLNGPKSLIITDTSFFSSADGPVNQPVPHNNAGSTLADFAPSNESDVRTIYGIDADTDLRMPFNRADYFIMRYDSAGKNIVPARCAPNTGVLEKVVISQATGQRTNALPLLDCVADMQIVYGLDMTIPDPTGKGIVTTYSDGDPFGFTEAAPGSTVIANGNDVFNVMNNVLDPRDLRRRLQEVRVYILAHEGAYDRDFNFSNFTADGKPCAGCTTITVGESALLTGDFDVKAKIDPVKYKNYRWKLYTLVVKPNLAGLVPTK